MEWIINFHGAVRFGIKPAIYSTFTLYTKCLKLENNLSGFFFGISK